MRALTITNPWAVFIALGLKRIENRDWSPPKMHLGTTIAIHAGKKSESAKELKEICTQLFSADLSIGYVLPTITDLLELQQLTAGKVVALATLRSVHSSIDTVPGDQRAWWVGDYGWELTNVQRVVGEPIRGQLGLWELPSKYKLVAP